MAERVCPHCQERHPIEAGFCPQTGLPLTAPNRAGSLVWIGAGTLILVLGVVVGVLVQRGLTPIANPPGAVTTESVADNAMSAVAPTETVEPTATVLPTAVVAASPDWLTLPEPVRRRATSDGEWEIYSNGSAANDLCLAGQVVWAATDGGIVAWDLATGQSKKYTVLDGLTVNTHYSIGCASDGTIWAASSESGLSHFDGQRWTADRTNRLTQIVRSPEGVLWGVDTTPYDDGRLTVGRYLQGTWVLSHFDDTLNLQGVGKAMAGPDGTLYLNVFSNDRVKIMSYDGQNWRMWSGTPGMPDPAALVAVDQDGVWWLQSEQGLGFWNSHDYVPVVPADALVGTAESIWNASDGSLWFQTLNYAGSGWYRTLTRWVGESGQNVGINDGLPSAEVTNVLPQSDGTVWFTTPDGIAVRRADTWSIYATHDVIGPGEVRALSISADGSLWLTIWGGGVAVLKAGVWQRFSEQDGLDSRYLWAGTIGSDGTPLFGSWSGPTVDFFQEGQWHTLRMDDQDGSFRRVWSVAGEPNGAIWAGTDHGASYWNGVSWRHFDERDGLPAGSVRAILIHPDGSVWIGIYGESGSGGAVARFDGQQWSVWSKATGLDIGAAAFDLMARGDGAVVVAPTGYGLWTFLNGRWIREDLAGQLYVNDLALDEDGSYWMASEFNGVQHVGTGQLLERFDHITAFMPGYRMASVAVATDGTYWFGGDGGVAHFIPYIR